MHIYYWPHPLDEAFLCLSSFQNKNCHDIIKLFLEVYKR